MRVRTRCRRCAKAPCRRWSRRSRASSANTAWTRRSPRSTAARTPRRCRPGSRSSRRRTSTAKVARRPTSRIAEPVTSPVPVDNSSFRGRGVLVTGASGGIGAATVRRLATHGATVYAAGRDARKLAALADETGAHPVTFDLASEDEVAAAVSGLDLWGVVNCGGFGGEIATPQDTDIAVFDEVITVNARGSLLVIKHVTPGMIERAVGGSIVNVSSQAGLVALSG